MKIWQRLLMAAAGAVGKLVQSGFGTTVKGALVNEASGNSHTIAVKGSYRYLLGNTGANTTDPIIAGTPMLKDLGLSWFVRVDDTGQPIWIASFGAQLNEAVRAVVADNGDLIVCLNATSSFVLYNADGTTFTPPETLGTNHTIARLGSDGFWVWARRLNIPSTNGGLQRVAEMDSVGDYIALSIRRQQTFTYRGVTYTSTGARALALFLDGDSNYLGHAYAASSEINDGGPIVVNSSGVARWQGWNNNGATVTTTIHGVSLSVAGNEGWLAELTATTTNILRTVPGSPTANLANLPDGGLAMTRSRSGSGTDDYGNGVVLTRTVSEHQLIRFDNTLTAITGRALNTAGTSVGRIGGVVNDGGDLVVCYALLANDTIAGNAISATSTNQAYVVHRVNRSTLADVWAVWAENTTGVGGWGGSITRAFFYIDDTSTAFAYVQVHPNSTGADLVLYPGAITYPRETDRYELFATISDTGVWETP